MGPYGASFTTSNYQQVSHDPIRSLFYYKIISKFCPITVRLSETFYSYSVTYGTTAICARTHTHTRRRETGGSRDDVFSHTRGLIDA